MISQNLSNDQPVSVSNIPVDNKKLFFCKNNNYHFYDSISLDEAQSRGINHLHIPLTVDTEFQCTLQQRPDLYTNPIYDLKLQKTITVQVKHCFDKIRRIYAHPDIKDIARHPLLTEEFILFQYLKDEGYSVEYKRYDSPRRVDNQIAVHIFAHFAVAELFRMGQGDFRDDLRDLSLGRNKRQKIDQGRRVIASNSYTPGRERQYVAIENLVTIINDVEYRINLCIWDTIAIAGTQSLEYLLFLAGLPTDDKSLLTQHDKENMIDTYLSKPDKFDQYATGDLNVYDVLIGIEERVKRIYEELKIPGSFKYAESLRFTIGATVAKIFEAKLLHRLKIKNIGLLRELTKHGNCEVIKHTNTTAAYIAKVDGGRCRNNRPIDVSVISLICDIDIDGCYGNGLRNQTYPLGRPILIEYPIDSKINDYLTLGEFLKEYKSELIPGLWTVRVSYKEGYIPKYGQDILMSWYPPKNLKDMPTDTELEGSDWWTESNVGTCKVLTHEVNLALINHDYLQLIDNVCGQRQRKELMDNLVVVAAAFYPKSCRVDTIEELVKAIDNHDGKNTVQVKNLKKLPEIINKNQECYSWMGINLGDLIVDELLKLRKQYPKKDPFNTLYKLIINTIYGDQVSPFFEIGNVVVGNNITARARCMAWYMEKGLHGFSTITDGCSFELNKVVYPDDRRLTSESISEAYCKSSHIANYRFDPLGGKEPFVKTLINNKPVLIKDGKEITNSDIGRMCMEHLQELFPNVDVLHAPTTNLKGETVNGQYALEVKMFADGIALHGSANYIMVCEGECTTKMRSYRKDSHMAIVGDGEKNLVRKEGYKPAEEFFRNVLENPTAVKRGLSFIDRSILKIKAWRVNYQRYESKEFYPGWNESRVRILREFSLNQFTFRTFAQYRSWEREYKNLINHTGQSYEQFFLNTDGTLNYQAMVVSIDKRIRKGDEGWFKRGGLRRYLESTPDTLKNHTEFNTGKEVRKNLGNLYGYDITDDLDGLSDGNEVIDVDYINMED